MLLVHPRLVARAAAASLRLVVAGSGSMSLISLTPKTDGTVG